LFSSAYRRLWKIGFNWAAGKVQEFAHARENRWKTKRAVGAALEASVRDFV
jgi:hypothetical protein